MKLEEMSNLDLAYLEGFVQKCGEADVDPELFLQQLMGEADKTAEPVDKTAAVDKVIELLDKKGGCGKPPAPKKSKSRDKVKQAIKQAVVANRKK